MTVTPEELERLLREVFIHLRDQYGTHPWFEDLHAEGRLAAWKALAKADGTGCLPMTRVKRAADWAALEWLRSRKNEGRTVGRKRPGRAAPVLPEVISGLMGEAAQGVTVDPMPGLLERLRGEQLTEWVLTDPELGPFAREVIVRVVIEGEGAGAVARDMGIGRLSLAKLQAAALTRLKERWEEERP